MSPVRAVVREFDTDVPDPSGRAGGPTGGEGGATFPPTVAAKLQNAVLRHRHYVLMAENGALDDILEPLREARKALTEQVADFAARDDAISDLSRMADERRKVLRRRIDEIINIAETDSSKATREALQKFAEREAEIQKNLLKRGIPDSVLNSLEIDLAGPDLERVRAMVDEPLGGERWTVRFKKNAAEMRKALRREMAKSIALGEGMEQAALRITDNIRKMGMNRATMIARSEIQRVANTTALRTYQANQDVIKQLEWVATLDGRTCPICGSKDGETWRIDKPPSVPPPVHPACRCILAPITRSFRELGLDEDELPATTRASMDGQVPATQNYPDWFRKQPAAFQRDVLGPARFKLYRQGAADFDDMVKSNRVLSVDELPSPAVAEEAAPNVDGLSLPDDLTPQDMERALEARDLADDAVPFGQIADQIEGLEDADDVVDHLNVARRIEKGSLPHPDDLTTAAARAASAAEEGAETAVEWTGDLGSVKGGMSQDEVGQAFEEAFEEATEAQRKVMDKAPGIKEFEVVDDLDASGRYHSFQERIQMRRTQMEHWQDGVTNTTLRHEYGHHIDAMGARTFQQGYQYASPHGRVGQAIDDFQDMVSNNPDLRGRLERLVKDFQMESYSDARQLQDLLASASWTGDDVLIDTGHGAAYYAERAYGGHAEVFADFWALEGTKTGRKILARLDEVAEDSRLVGELRSLVDDLAEADPALLTGA